MGFNEHQDLRKLEEFIHRAAAKRDHVAQELKRSRLKLRAQKRYLEDVEEARNLMQTAAEMAQRHLEFQISNLVSSALYSVFPNPYKFIVRFVSRRNTTECDMFFERNECEMEPEFASGGGPLDVASFACRISQLTLEGVAPLVILDEPFKNLSKNLMENACAMLNALKEKLGIQFIIVTHVPELVKAGDAVFRVHDGEVMPWQE